MKRIIVTASKGSLGRHVEIVSPENIIPVCPSAEREEKSKAQIKTNINLCLALRSLYSCQILPAMALTLKMTRNTGKLDA